MLQLLHVPVVARHTATVQVADALLRHCAGDLCMCHLQGIQAGKTVHMSNLQAEAVQAMGLHIGKAAPGNHYRSTLMIKSRHPFCQSTHCVTKAVGRRRGSNPENQPAVLSERAAHPRSKAPKLLQFEKVQRFTGHQHAQVVSPVSLCTVCAHTVRQCIVLSACFDTTSARSQASKLLW